MAFEIEPLGADNLLELWLETGEIAFRDQLVAHHLPLACRLCRRFQNLGEPIDDLIRVGAMGLMKAIDRYGPHCRNKFTTFAIPAILGEIKAHFRHHGWGTILPGKLQRQKLLVDRIVETLALHLGRSPTVAEIGEAAALSQEEVFQTFEVEGIRQTLSLNTGPAADPSKHFTPVVGYDGEEDPGLESLSHEMDLKVALAGIDAREQTVMYLKLHSKMSHSAIARRLGISQIHVSRLQLSGVAKLRLRLGECVRR